MASSSYNYTCGSTGNQKTLTLAGWFKVSATGGNVSFFTYYSTATNNPRSEIFASSSTQKLMVGINPTGLTWYELTYPNVIRDPTAWYHIVVAYDTTQAVEADRVKTYINGNQITAASGTYPTLNLDTGYNLSGTQHQIGRYQTSALYLDGCAAHVHFIDGTAYAASDFGEFDSTSGIWIAKTSPSVTYGTNGGFYKFASGALTTDSSGEDNTLTSVGTPTPTKDTPDNNFCTINPLSYHIQSSLGSLANGNTTATTVASGHFGTYVPTLGVDAGKWYIEGKAASVTGSDRASAGVVSMEDSGINKSTSWYAGEHSTDTGYQSDGNYWVAGSNTGGWSTYTTGDIIGIALDLDNRKVYFHKNGVYEGSGDPVAGTNGLAVTADVNIGLAFSAYNASSWNINYGNGYFGTTVVSSANADDAGIGAMEYDVPAGYYCLCTKNIKAYGG